MGQAGRVQLSFQEHLTELCNEADQAVRKIAYLNALIGNADVCEKIDGSLSGFAPAAANRAIVESVILFCARMWDNKPDTLSLPIIKNRIPPTNYIVTQQICKNPQLDKHAAQTQFDSRMQEWHQQFDSFSQDPMRRSLRIFRNEWLGHRIHESHERINLGTGSTVQQLTYDDIVNQATRTVMLVGDLDAAVNRHNNLYPDRLRTSEADCREFWRILPVLKVAENLSNKPPTPKSPQDS